MAVSADRSDLRSSLGEDDVYVVLGETEFRPCLSCVLNVAVWKYAFR